MFRALGALIPALLPLVVHAEAAIPGYIQANGVTRLLGSSFGIPGLNLTYDYVVSLRRVHMKSQAV